MTIGVPRRMTKDCRLLANLAGRENGVGKTHNTHTVPKKHIGHGHGSGGEGAGVVVDST